MSKSKCSLLSCEIDAATQAKLVPYYVEIPILFGLELNFSLYLIITIRLNYDNIIRE
jgi:hypothetical protein